MKRLFLILLILIITNLTIGCNSKEKSLSKGQQGAKSEVGIEVGGNNCNPYEYITDYIPMQIPSIITQDDTIIFQQIYNIDADTDKMVDNLYKEYSANLSEGIKECFPEFDKEGNVSFSRISDDDYERYQLYLNYIGSNGLDLLLNLDNMPAHLYSSLECVTFQKNSNVELALLSISLYSNINVNVLISKDFSQIQSVYDNNTYQELDELLSSENTSILGGINMANIYHYQQRIWRRDTNSSTEEQFIYYTYLKKDELEYIIEFKSNYTLMEGQKKYAIVGDLYSQEDCRNMLLSVLKIIINS